MVLKKIPDQATSRPSRGILSHTQWCRPVQMWWAHSECSWCSKYDEWRTRHKGVQECIPGNHNYRGFHTKRLGSACEIYLLLTPISSASAPDSPALHPICSYFPTPLVSATHNSNGIPHVFLLNHSRWGLAHICVPSIVFSTSMCAEHACLFIWQRCAPQKKNTLVETKLAGADTMWIRNC